MAAAKLIVMGLACHYDFGQGIAIRPAKFCGGTYSIRLALCLGVAGNYPRRQLFPAFARGHSSVLVNTLPPELTQTPPTICYNICMTKVAIVSKKKNVEKWTKIFVKKYRPALKELSKK